MHAPAVGLSPRKLFSEFLAFGLLACQLISQAFALRHQPHYVRLALGQLTPQPLLHAIGLILARREPVQRGLEGAHLPVHTRQRGLGSAEVVFKALVLFVKR